MKCCLAIFFLSTFIFISFLAYLEAVRGAEDKKTLENGYAKGMPGNFSRKECVAISLGRHYTFSLLSFGGFNIFLAHFSPFLLVGGFFPFPPYSYYT